MDSMLYILITLVIVILVLLMVILIRKYIASLIDKHIANYQNDLITKHCSEVQNIYSQMRGWRHDYHNHIQTMKAFITLGRELEHIEYLSKLDADLESVDMVLKTGNVMVDAIINSKVSLAATKKINVDAKVVVPEKLNISEIDLCVIIGNLIDNAMEACVKLPSESERFIRIYIGRHKEMLYISVVNAASGDIKKIGKIYFSTKESHSHGFGLMRVDRIAAKYGGFVNRQNEEGVFATEIMLPL